MTEPALILKDVSKTINHTPIVQSISFDVRKGEIFGLLGPNSSGKTTIFRMIVQLIKKQKEPFHSEADRTATLNIL